VPLRPPQIPHGLTRDRTRASAVGGRKLSHGTAQCFPLVWKDNQVVQREEFPANSNNPGIYSIVATTASNKCQSSSPVLTLFQ
jgi:hypothetical protein